MLDPASSVEMVKVLEEDPMVGGVGGDVQVSFQINRGVSATIWTATDFPTCNSIEYTVIPLQRLLWYLNLSICWTGTLILGWERCIVLTPTESRRLLYMKSGALALSGLLWHLWVSGYNCLLRVPKKSYRGAGNWEQVSQSQVRHPKHFNYVVTGSQDC